MIDQRDHEEAILPHPRSAQYLRAPKKQILISLARMAAGEPARLVRTRGNYVLIRTRGTLGWVEQDQFGLTCPRKRAKAARSQRDHTELAEVR